MIALSTAQWKIVGACLAGLLLIGAVLFTVNKCDTWRDNRAITKAKEKVNASLANLANAQANVQKDAVEVAVREQEVKDATNAVLVASNASTVIQTQTNAVLANLNATIAANKPVGTTAEQLNDQLRDLDGQ